MQFLGSAKRWPFLRPGLHAPQATSAAQIKSGRRPGLEPRASPTSFVGVSMAKPRLLSCVSTARCCLRLGILNGYQGKAISLEVFEIGNFPFRRFCELHKQM